MENLEKEPEKNPPDYTPFSREVNNYLTTKAKTVKMDMYKTVFNGLLCWIIQVDLIQWE